MMWTVAPRAGAGGTVLPQQMQQDFNELPGGVAVAFTADAAVEASTLLRKVRRKPRDPRLRRREKALGQEAIQREHAGFGTNLLKVFSCLA